MGPLARREVRTATLAVGPEHRKVVLRLESLVGVTVARAGRRAPEAPTFVAVGDGPGGKLRWELLGLHSGPLFAAQATPPEAYVQYVRRALDASSLNDWVEWRQSIVE